MEKKRIIMQILLYMLIPYSIVLNVFNQNFGFISITSLNVLSICLAIVGAVMGLLITFVTKKSEYSILVLLIFWLLFWTYNDIYRSTAKYGITSKILLPVIFLILIILTIMFRKIKRNHIVSLAVPVTIIILFAINAITFIFHYAVYISNDIPYHNDNQNLQVDFSLQTPNIYWIHCDGMMSFTSVSEYFGYDNSELYDYIENEDFFINENASMEVGHLTMQALPALTCPNYYDTILKDYFFEKQGSFFDGSTVNKIAYTTDLVNAKIDNELVEALEAKGYETNVIADNGGEFAFYSDNFYYSELGGVQREHPREKSMLLYELEVDILPLLLKETMFCPFYNILNQEDTTIMSSNEESIFFVSENEKLTITKKAFDDVVFRNCNPQFTFVALMTAHAPFEYDENGNIISITNYAGDPDDYVPSWKYTGKLITELVQEIKSNDPDAVIIIEGDHGCHFFSIESIQEEWPNATKQDVLNIWNSVMSAVYIPEQYRNEDTIYLQNPLNISRFLINNYVGSNYEYLNIDE